MPLVPDSSRVPTASIDARSIIADIDPDQAEPGFFDVLPAAFRQENVLVNLAQWATQERPESGVQNPEFDPFAAENITGYELFAGAFVDADSEDDMALVKERIDQEQNDRRLLEEAGVGGIGAMLLAGFIDPIVFVPVGGAAVKAYQSGKILRSGYLTARAAVVGATVAESALHLNQVDRDLTQSAFAITGAAFLGGVMGSAVGALSSRTLARAAREAEAFTDLAEPNPVGKLAGGVGGDDVTVSRQAQDLQETLTQDDASPILDELQSQGLLKATGLTKLGPELRIFVHSTSGVTRSHTGRLTRPPLAFKRNAEGIASGSTRVERVGGRPESMVGVRGEVVTKRTGKAVQGDDGSITTTTPTVGRARAPKGTQVEILEEVNSKGKPGNTHYRVAGNFDTEVKASRVSVAGGARAGVAEVVREQLFEVVDPSGLVLRTHPTEQLAAADAAALGRGAEVVQIKGGFEVVEESGLASSTHKSKRSADAQALALTLHEGEPVIFRGKEAAFLGVTDDGKVRINLDDEFLISQTSVKTQDFGESVPTVVDAPAKNQPVQTRVMLWQANLGKSLDETNRLFTDYRLRVAQRPDTRINRARVALADVRFPSVEPDPNKLTRRQFRERAFLAGMRDDLDFPTKGGPKIPEVEEAAKVWRAQVFDPLLDGAIAAKILPEGIKEAQRFSYMTRVYHVGKILKNPDQFKEIIRPWLERQHPEMNATEVRSALRSIVSSITDAPMGRTHYDTEAKISVAGQIKKRSLTFGNDEVAPEFLDFLEKDIEVVGSMYVNTVAPDVELAREFGDVAMTSVFEDIIQDFALKSERVAASDLSAAAKSKKQVALDKELKSIAENWEETSTAKGGRGDLVAMRDRLRGTFGAPTNPNAWFIRSGRTVRQLNLLAQGGGFMISSIPDLARTTMVHGLGRTLRDGVVPLVRSMRNPSIRNMSLDELRDAAIGWERVLDTRATSMFDVGQERLTRGSWGEQGIQSLAARMSVVNLLSQWNRSQKQFAGIVTQARMLDAMESIAKGASRPKELAKLAEQGIDPAAARRLAGHFAKHGESDRGFRIAHSDRWIDGLEGDDLAQAFDDIQLFRGATLNEVDKIIVTPGIGDRPLWTSTELGRTIFQYKSFALSATTRVMLSALQQRDMAALNGAYLSVGLGMMVYNFKTWQAGKETDDDWMTWIREGIDRSGLVGIVSDVNNMAEKVNLGVANLTGGPQASRYASRNLTSSIAGPSLGVGETAAQLISSVASGDFTQSDTRALRRLAPYQNLFWLRSLFDAGEDAFNETLGIPKRSRGRRR